MYFLYGNAYLWVCKWYGFVILYPIQYTLLLLPLYGNLCSIVLSYY